MTFMGSEVRQHHEEREDMFRFCQKNTRKHLLFVAFFLKSIEKTGFSKKRLLGLFRGLGPAKGPQLGIHRWGGSPEVFFFKTNFVCLST